MMMLMCCFLCVVESIGLFVSMWYIVCGDIGNVSVCICWVIIIWVGGVLVLLFDIFNFGDYVGDDLVVVVVNCVWLVVVIGLFGN